MVEHNFAMDFDEVVPPGSILNPFGDSAAPSTRSAAPSTRSAAPSMKSAAPSMRSAAPSVRMLSLRQQPSSTSRTTTPESDYKEKRQRHKFRSYRLVGKYEQPWLEDPRMWRTKYNSLIVYCGALVGIILSAYICYRKIKSVPFHDYCLILDDEFATIDSNIWTHEVQIDGFGTGSFDWTTTDNKNTFVDAEGLHIVPTLTNETTSITSGQIFNGYNLNLTKAGGDGSCTSTDIASCSIRSNDTLGHLIPPVRSARLTTAGKKTIKYGKVEVTAKFPKGDWIWPAVWMYPQDSAYGYWPRSGEIDLAESRGNSYNYSINGVAGGRNVISSTLHWGPSTDSDAFWRTTNGKALRRTDYSDEYHKFGVEWSEDYVYTYIDSRLVQVMYLSFKNEQNLWQRGNFSTQTENGTFLEDPWLNATTNHAPFDQEFYLILNVAVGANNGYFRDGVDSKPWIDGAANAAWDFWSSADKWLPTWGEGADRGMTVKRVQMWQQGKCGVAAAASEKRLKR